VAYAVLDEIEIIDLGWPWRSIGLALKWHYYLIKITHKNTHFVHIFDTLADTLPFFSCLQ